MLQLKNILFPLLLLLSIPTVFAKSPGDDWVLVATTDDNMKVYVNLNIKKSDSYTTQFRVWILYQLPASRKLYKNIYYKECKDFLEFDSDFTEYETLSSVYYNKKGNVVYSADRSYTTDYVVPGTVMDAVARFARTYVAYTY